MWTSVLVLAVALNFEPTRFVLVPMLLSRRQPLVQLLAYSVGSITVNLVFGLLILFVFRSNPLGTDASAGGKAQIAVGLVALIIAVIMAIRSRRIRPNEKVDAITFNGPDQARGIEKALVGARVILRKGSSPWFAGLLGMGVGLPSVDFMAVLVIIGTSHKPPLEQTAALVTFIIIGGLVILPVFIGYLFAPAKTLQYIERFAAWTRSRSQLEYSALVAFVGAVLVAVGWSRL